MNYLTLEGSERTHKQTDNEKLMKDATPFPAIPFKLFAYNYEPWLYHALQLNKDNPRLKRLRVTAEHVLFPDVDCTLYIRKTKEFPALMRKLVSAFLPFRAGLIDTIEVSLWDEGDRFLDMTVTSVEEREDDFLVYYTHPDGEPMEVKGSDLGDDEILNLITALVEHNEGKMSKLPSTVKLTYSPA